MLSEPCQAEQQQEAEYTGENVQGIGGYLVCGSDDITRQGDKYNHNYQYDYSSHGFIRLLGLKMA